MPGQPRKNIPKIRKHPEKCNTKSTKKAQKCNTKNGRAKTGKQAGSEQAAEGPHTTP